MRNSTKLQLGFSPLTKTIYLAKMRDVDGGRLRVGNDRGRDVTNEAAQMVWQLVMAEDGEIAWDMDDGSRMVLRAEKQECSTGSPGVENERTAQRIAESEQNNAQLLRERDSAQAALSDMYTAVTGQSPEWNNDSDYTDAIAEVEVACTLWRAVSDDPVKFRRLLAELENIVSTDAAADVISERLRQLTVEGRTAEQDDHYSNLELRNAAVCYICPSLAESHWPWADKYWKPTSARRNLEKAGALILAEMERLDRQKHNGILPQ